MATFSVKNFAKYQHYKDRSPPWIKLYNELLDDYAFAALPDASKAHLLAIWLLASRYNNEIPLDAEWVSRRINATVPVDLNLLTKAGFIVSDQACSNLLADCKQIATPETERETEKEVEKIQSKKVSISSAPSALELVDVAIRLPTNRAGEEVELSHSQAAEFADLYPSVDVGAELRAMRGWLISNPTKRKTRTGMLKFVNSWLLKQQNRGSVNGTGQRESAHTNFAIGAFAAAEEYDKGR